MGFLRPDSSKPSPSERLVPVSDREDSRWKVHSGTGSQETHVSYSTYLGLRGRYQSATTSNNPIMTRSDPDSKHPCSRLWNKVTTTRGILPKTGDFPTPGPRPWTLKSARFGSLETQFWSLESRELASYRGFPTQFAHFGLDVGNPREPDSFVPKLDLFSFRFFSHSVFPHRSIIRRKFIRGSGESDFRGIGRGLGAASGR